MVAVGVGCQRGVALATLEQAIDTALRPLGAVVVCCLASHACKSDEPALLELARRRGWPRRFYPAEALAEVAISVPLATCARASRAVGTPSVAEAAAWLAAAGGELLVAKQCYRGRDDKSVTVAVARRLQSP